MSNLKLRPLRETDFKIYCRMVSNPGIAKAARFQPAKTQRAAQRLFKTDLQHADGYAVTLNGRVVGMIALYSTIGKHGAPDLTVLELADLMLPEFQNRGYMGRAIGLLIRKFRGTRHSHVKRLVALVSEDNVASQKVLLKNHFHSYTSVMDMTSGGEDLIYQFNL